MAFPIILTGGQVTVNESPLTPVDLICPAWGTHDEGFTQLVNPPDLVGAGAVQMHGGYPIGTAKTPGPSVRTVPLYVVKECDHNGAALGPGGAWTNFMYLREHVLDPPSKAARPDGTRYVLVTLPNGVELEGDCHISAKVSKPTASGWYVAVQFEIIRGSLAEVEGS